ncbi:GAP family protein [Mycobacteroides sp. LB1]|uniref:GAP family protein n=1 Tax=Mycobacteroides sp. LB1 TaxID=2750814 RepID=UPI0015DEA005|nr:GAP family protein [Mycobacteroides sp. LB1]
MWGLLLVMAIMFAVNPVLLAIIVLMISRPRPVQNLAAYWLGSMIVSLAGLLIPLMVLHIAPSFRSFVEDLATPGKSPTTRFFNLGMGLLMLSIAAVMAVRSARQRSRIPVSASNTAALTQDSDTSNLITSPFGNPQDAAAEGGSVFRRLLRHLQNAWENGALWVAFVFGLCGLPPPMLVLFVLTPVVASGTPIGTQIIAVILFVFGMFAIVEITLVSYLAAPAKTLAVLRPLHDWALVHRRQMLITIFSVAGLIQVVNGIA